MQKNSFSLKGMSTDHKRAQWKRFFIGLEFSKRIDFSLVGPNDQIVERRHFGNKTNFRSFFSLFLDENSFHFLFFSGSI